VIAVLISIVNHCRAIVDADLQAVIRAINRQVRDDFEPYWGRSARLRLEGRSLRAPKPEQASDLRGEAVVYLCDSPGEADDALGYHELNHRGVPYGFVFKELCDELGEAWSITLSHEVLELILDPEANLLVKGPHPEDDTREVYHWYEACDAVQAQAYEVDGVQVSNFLLPLYFTTREERGARNDFLGAARKGPRLASFGVADGGYIGFYDPVVGDDITYEPSPRARRRRQIKLKASLTRRSVRYQRNAAPHGYFEGLAGPTAPPPELECISLRMARERGAEQAARSAVHRALGRGWKTTRTAGSATEFDAVPRRDPPDCQRAWELTYRLRAVRAVERAEPLFRVHVADDEARQEFLGARLGRLMRASGGSLTANAPEDPEWSVKLVRADRAWRLLDDKQLGYGEGIRIGHPDTGFTEHPEIAAANINRDLDRDFLTGDDDASDPLDDGPLLYPGHGTATASVIMSPPGAEGAGYEHHVSGIAPAAELVPLRVSESVIHLSMRNVRDAVDHAVASGCHVISMSLGGLPSGSLHDAIRRALDAGVIVVAAAGNRVQLVVWPARYEESIAVAACNSLGEPWSGSSRGSAVDVSAPGEAVYRACWAHVDEHGAQVRKATVEPSDGTSYATATVAGIAALWLSYHGREALVDRYPGALLPRAFRALLERTCRSDVSLPDGFGRGLVDAEALLRAPLPAAASLRAAATRGRRRGRARPSAARRAGKDPSDPVERLASLFAGVAPSAARAGLTEILGEDVDARAARFGDELVFRLIQNPDLHAAFFAHMKRVERAQASPGLRAQRGRSPGARARTLQVRAALTADEISKDLRDSLWGG
jgi:subtilisin family serine protease